MSELERILEDSLAQITLEGKSLEEVVARYPEHADQLRPLLQASQKLMNFEGGLPSPEFKQRGRAALGAHMRAHPVKIVSQRPRTVMRFAVGFATLMLAFATVGTAFAQSALPGQALYGWKLASERVWRSVHVNRVYVDLELSSRRLKELLAVQNDPQRARQALADYAASLAVLQNDVTLSPTKALSARNVISAHKEAVRSLLDESGQNADEFFIILPNLDGVIKANPDQDLPATTPESQIPLATIVPPLGNKNENKGGDSSASEQGGGQSIGEAVNEAIDDLLGLP